MDKELDRILHFIFFSENLKKELRHSWLSNGRPESVAEHVWRTSLMAILIAPLLEKRVNLERVLKMIIIHDIVEAEVGDMPAFISEEGGRKKEKEANERRAIENIRGMLSNLVGDEIYELWHEFEEKKSYEAQFAAALDKLEAALQHIEADISTWLEIEQERIFYMLEPTCSFDKCIIHFKEEVKKRAIEKMRTAGLDVEAIKNRALKIDEAM
jgi:putative hydrolase of HD superfamily